MMGTAIIVVHPITPVVAGHGIVPRGAVLSMDQPHWRLIVLGWSASVAIGLSFVRWRSQIADALVCSAIPHIRPLFCLDCPCGRFRPTQLAGGMRRSCGEHGATLLAAPADHRRGVCKLIAELKRLLARTST